MPVNADQHYFAYGPNMPRRYLYNVRGVLPAQSDGGFIGGYEVRFLGPGMNGLEPAFAYLLKAEGKKAYGVLHRVSSQDLLRVKESEGPLYEWAILPVTLGNGHVVAAQTLVRLSPGEAGVPSRRYKRLLIEGATEHGLPSPFVSELNAMPSVYVPVLSDLMGDVMHAFVLKASGKCTSLITC